MQIRSESLQPVHELCQAIIIEPTARCVVATLIPSDSGKIIRLLNHVHARPLEHAQKEHLVMFI